MRMLSIDGVRSYVVYILANELDFYLPLLNRIKLIGFQTLHIVRTFIEADKGRTEALQCMI